MAWPVPLAFETDHPGVLSRLSRRQVLSWVFQFPEGSALPVMSIR